MPQELEKRKLWLNDHKDDISAKDEDIKDYEDFKQKYDHHKVCFFLSFIKCAMVWMNKYTKLTFNEDDKFYEVMQ